MPKLLISAVSAKSGGASTYIYNLVAELTRDNYGFSYIFYVPKALAESIKTRGDNISIVATEIGSAASWRRFLWDQVVLRAIIKKERIDILVSSSDFGMAFSPCRQVLLIRNALFFSQCYLQHIVPNQNRRSRLNFFLRRWLVLLSAKSSDIVMMASRSMLEDVRRFIHLSDKRGVVNYFGVPLEIFGRKAATSPKPLEHEASKPFRLLYVSTYSDYKNLTTLLKAVRILVEYGNRDFTLVTTCDPWQFPEVEVISRQEDEALAAHPQVAPFVKFAGTVLYQNVAQLYTDADLFVFPSLVESFGHPLVEAMASGVPILAGDIPISREICANAAVYFSVLDSSDLADKILLLWRDSYHRRQLGELGRKRAEKQFDWKDHVRRLVEVIEQVGVNA